MRKEEIINHWQGIKANQPIAISPVPYKHTGSTYAEDGIRLTGSKPFIDSVLSRLTELLEHENSDTRLQLVYKQSVDKDTGVELPSFNCYVQVHERGQEARMCNAFIDGIKNHNFKKYNTMAMDMTREALAR